MVRTYEPSALSDRAPLSMVVNPKTPWYSKLLNDTAWRIYLATLLVANLVLSLAVIGSLQQVYNSVNSLTEFVGNSIMNPPTKASPIEVPKQNPEKKQRHIVPQRFEPLEFQRGTDTPPKPATHFYEHEIQNVNQDSYYIAKHNGYQSTH